MSPARLNPHHRAEAAFPEASLSIVGIGVQYPPYSCKPQDLKKLALRHHRRTPALQKILAINENTGIDTRSVACTLDHPLLNKPEPPTVDELSEFFLSEGVKLAVDASRRAIEEWGGDVSELTHLVATTCTNSANPGYDYHVARELGVTGRVERTLLHGVGCAGGLAALRTAANLALLAACLGRPARILVVAAELASTLARSELASLDAAQELRIAVTLYSDGASALVLSNGVGARGETPLYGLLAWDSQTLPDTEGDIAFDVHPHGWKVHLSPRVPALSCTAVPPLFNSLLRRTPALQRGARAPCAADFDWALHPSGTKVLSGAQALLALTPDHLRASHDVYRRHGNSSSATLFSILDRLRGMGEGREHVVGCAFGPGVTVEMCILRRSRHSGSPECSLSEEYADLFSR
ncbi:chalcone synthase [Phanerochaete sordida]|uniref:Chalcone synthase n=1 Tax=Phanerochaete sordida TaxID=48140 RepID=A0A9P3L7D7_9APHY|nr:chalcone synthase [Phanerochaete sordida]